MSARVQYMLTDEAIAIINDAASERKRGDWLSKAVLEYSRIVALVPDDNTCGTLEQIAGKLGRIEQRLAVLDSRVSTLLEQKEAWQCCKH